MTNAQHTPGPWSVSWKDSRQQSDYYWEVPIRVGAASNAGNSLCRVYMGAPGAIYSNKEVVEANARLIAAAPDMLEALQLFVEGFDPAKEYTGGFAAFEDKARIALAAIAKATTNA